MASKYVLQGLNTVTKTMPHRGANYTADRLYKATPRPISRPPAKQQQYKRARISTESTESAPAAGETQTLHCVAANLSLDYLNTLTKDLINHCTSVCLQDILRTARDI